MNQVKLHKKIGLEKAPEKGAFKDHLKNNFLENNFGKSYYFLRLVESQENNGKIELSVDVDKTVFTTPEDIDGFLKEYYSLKTNIIPSPGDLLQGDK